jgi:hypothetical protein
MNEIQIGQNVRVRFNGRLYRGQVIALSPKRFQVRFTTGSGKTRKTWFRKDRFLITGIAGAYANTATPDPVAPVVPEILNEGGPVYEAEPHDPTTCEPCRNWRPT